MRFQGNPPGLVQVSYYMTYHTASGHDPEKLIPYVCVCVYKHVSVGRCVVSGQPHWAAQSALCELKTHTEKTVGERNK